jgi:hypothetical protein
MSSLRDRIFGKNVPDHPLPATTGKEYGAPTEIPLTQIAIYANGVGYDEPLVTTDGAPISNTSRGQWGQLYKAGR